MTTDRAGLVPEFDTSDRLRKAREVAGYEQAEFAELIGVSRGTVSNYERGGTKRYKPIVVRAWALSTGVSLEWLMDGITAPTPTPPGNRVEDRQAALARLAASKRRGGRAMTPSDQYLVTAA